MNDGKYVDVDKVIVRPIGKDVAKSFIDKHHYLHRSGICTHSFGIYYLEDKDHPFFDGENEVLVGAMIFRWPVGFRAVNSIFEGIEIETNETLELTRLAILDGYGTNIESYSISQVIRWIKENLPDIKVLISYADAEQNHVGTIYQATNWLYQGYGVNSPPGNYSIKLKPDGEWIHAYTIAQRIGPVSLETLMDSYGPLFWRKRELPKHRYLYFLGNKKQRKNFRDHLKYSIVPYPKENDQNISNIERVELIDGEIVISKEADNDIR